MANRDASRIKLKYPDLDYDGDGSVDSTSAFYACVHGGPNWSGFTKTKVNVTCSNTTLDDWGNIVKQYRSGKIIDLGTVSFDIDWDPNLVSTEESLALAAFYDGRTADFLLEIPAEGAETAGPILTLTMVQEGFTPTGNVLAEGDAARLSATVMFQINAIAVTAATTP
jgi:hypothetical protein